MKPSSAKSKGRRLSQVVATKILEEFPELTEKDVRVTPSGVNGSDVQLSQAAFEKFGFSIECKNLASITVYKHYEQAMQHADKEKSTPIVVMKQNHKAKRFSEPLVLISLEDFFKLLKKNLTENNS